MRLSVVIPAYNEAERIAATLDAAGEFLSQAGMESELVVVDDGSTDPTADRVRARIADYPVRLRLLEMPHRGKGAAVRTGMLAAAGDLRFLCDADLSMAFSELPSFLDAAAAGPDVVVGSRQVRGSLREGDGWLRHFLGRSFNFLVKILAVQGIEDTQCGYKLFTAKAAEAIFPRLTLTGFAFDVETLFLARLLGFEIREIPIHWTHHPSSRLRPLRDAPAMFLGLLRIRWNALLGRYQSARATAPARSPVAADRTPKH